MQQEDNNEPNKFKEPATPYSKKTITIFKSFEEQESYEINQVLLQSPEKRLSQTSVLIIRMFGFTREKLAERKPSGKIKFRK